MNAAEFYEQFKYALKYLGLRWGEMDKATITIFGNSVRFAYDGRECGFEL